MSNIMWYSAVFVVLLFEYEHWVDQRTVITSVKLEFFLVISFLLLIFSNFHHVAFLEFSGSVPG